MARELLDTVEQGIEVPIHGFDRLMFDLAKAYGVAVTPFQAVLPPVFPIDAPEVASPPAVLNIALAERLPSSNPQVPNESKAPR